VDKNTRISFFFLAKVSNRQLSLYHTRNEIFGRLENGEKTLGECKNGALSQNFFLHPLFFLLDNKSSEEN